MDLLQPSVWDSDDPTVIAVLAAGPHDLAGKFGDRFWTAEVPGQGFAVTPFFQLEKLLAPYQGFEEEDLSPLIREATFRVFLACATLERSYRYMQQRLDFVAKNYINGTASDAHEAGPVAPELREWRRQMREPNASVLPMGESDILLSFYYRATYGMPPQHEGVFGIAKLLERAEEFWTYLELCLVELRKSKPSSSDMIEKALMGDAIHPYREFERYSALLLQRVRLGTLSAHERVETSSPRYKEWQRQLRVDLHGIELAEKLGPFPALTAKWSTLSYAIELDGKTQSTRATPAWGWEAVPHHSG